MSGVSNYAITVIFSLQTLYNCLSSTIGQFVYAFYLETYPNASNHSMINAYRLFETSSNETNKCVKSDNSSDGDARLWAQKQSSNLFFWIHLISSIPLILVTYILGLYTSKLGKRLVLLLPMAGGAMQVTIWLAIIYFKLPDFWWYIAAILISLTGSGGVFSLTLNLIITENTTESERSSRFVRLNAMQTAIAAVATFITGYYIAWRGFKDLYWMALLIQISSMIITVFFFKSVDDNSFGSQMSLLSTNTEVFHELSSSNCSRFWKVFTVFRWNRRSKKKSISLYLTLFANTFFLLALASFAPFLWLLLSAPFCWTSKDVGNFVASGAISSAILSLIGMQILTYVGARDAVICVITHIFFSTACLWIAFARYGWQLYVALLITAFSGYQGSLTTSMMSKWLEVYERNHAFTFVTELNTIATTFGSAFFNWIYSQSVVHHRTLTLFIAAGLAVIPLVLNISLVLLTRKMPDEEEESPLPQVDDEPIPLHLPSNLLPHPSVADCMIILAQPLISSRHTATGERSRFNSDSDHDTQDDALINDTPVL